VDAGVTGMVTSLQVWQGWFAVGAACMDVAVASTTEAPFLEIHGDDGVQVIVCIGAPVFIVQGISFSLDNAVNSVSPNVRGVTA